MLHDSCPCEESVSGCQTGSAQHTGSAGLRCRFVPGPGLAHTSALQTQTDRHDACARRYRVLLRRRRSRRPPPAPSLQSLACVRVCHRLHHHLHHHRRPLCPPSACSPIDWLQSCLALSEPTPADAKLSCRSPSSPGPSRSHLQQKDVFTHPLHSSSASAPLPDAHVCATTKLPPSANRTQSHTTGPARPAAHIRPSTACPARPCIPATLVVDPDAFPAWRATSLLRIAHLLWLERSDQHHLHHYHSPALQPPPTLCFPTTHGRHPGLPNCYAHITTYFWSSFFFLSLLLLLSSSSSLLRPRPCTHLLHILLIVPSAVRVIIQASVRPNSQQLPCLC